MILLGIMLKNILCFKELKIDFNSPFKTLTKNQILTSSISPNFHIIYGKNSSGKTCLSKIINNTINFLKNKEIDFLLEILNNSEPFNEISLAFLNENAKVKRIYRVIIRRDLSFNSEIKIAINYIEFTNDFSYENVLKILDNLTYDFQDLYKGLNEINLTWNLHSFINHDIIDFPIFASKQEETDYLNIVNDVFKNINPSIINVKKSLDSSDAYVIIKQPYNKKIIVQKDMKLSFINNLSSSAKLGFNISNIIYCIKHYKNSLFIIDEQFNLLDLNLQYNLIRHLLTLISKDSQLILTTNEKTITELKRTQ